MGSFSGERQRRGSQSGRSAPQPGPEKAPSTLTIRKLNLGEWGWGVGGREPRKSPGLSVVGTYTWSHLQAYTFLVGSSPWHSPCFADTAGRTAEPSGTGEVACCPRHCGSSPGLGNKRRFRRGTVASPFPASRRSALNDSTLPSLALSVGLSPPAPSPSHPQVPNRWLLSHFTKKTVSSDTSVSSDNLHFLSTYALVSFFPPMSWNRGKPAPTWPFRLTQALAQ